MSKSMIGLPAANVPVFDELIVSVVDEQRHAVDTRGGVAVEERHHVAHLLGRVRRAAGGLAVVLRERQPQVGVGSCERSVGRPRADRVDSNALGQERECMRRDICVDRLLAGAAVAEVVRLVGFAPGVLPIRSRAWPRTPEASASRFPSRCRPLRR